MRLSSSFTSKRPPHPSSSAFPVILVVPTLIQTMTFWAFVIPFTHAQQGHHSPTYGICTQPPSLLSLSHSQIRASSFLSSRHFSPSTPTINPHKNKRKSNLSLNATLIFPTPIASNLLTAFLVNIPIYIFFLVSPQGMLTREALLHAFVLGTTLWTAMSWQGWFVAFGFLVLSSIATKLGYADKLKKGIAEKRGGKRGPENLWGAAATGFCASLLMILATLVLKKGGLMAKAAHHLSTVLKLLQLAFVASFCTKFSDSVSSEIGKAYGSTTYLITTLKIVPRGTEGAVSLEGTLAGIAASVLGAAFACSIARLISPIGALICVIAAFVGNTAESFIGAALQEKLNWSNEAVNFINTLIGATVALILASIRVYLGCSF